MDPERRKRGEELFKRAMGLPAEQREAFLQECAATNPSLAADVRSLLAIPDTQINEFLATPTTVAKAGGQDSAPTKHARIGHYTILRKLGEGGMGVVYEARQDNPRRHVALKVIRPGFSSPEAIRRFQQEAQALGLLQHPGIAQIYEAGTAKSPTAGGLFVEQPYLAMEFIRGEPLLEYASKRDLSTRARLELLAKVCDAVQHAHQKGVIHRDLKPGNILVVDEQRPATGGGPSVSPDPESAEVGQPKVLDFGTARFSQAKVRSNRIDTEVGRIIGTPQYMSPEQAAGQPEDIDTRSDVYAIGVIAFELLTGQLPYRIGTSSLLEIVRVIREQAAERLSSVSRSLRGDVETIVGKALEKEKERRYTSVAEMAADIRRFLNDQPILAHPPSVAYTFAKFVRRNRILVAASVVAAALLVCGLVAGVSSYFAIQKSALRASEKASRDALAKLDAAESERQQAETARDEAEAADEKVRQLAWEIIQDLPVEYLVNQPNAKEDEGSRYLQAAVDEFLSSMEQRAGDDALQRLDIARIRGLLGDLRSRRGRGGIGGAMQDYGANRQLRDLWPGLLSRSPDRPDAGFHPKATSAAAMPLDSCLEEVQSLEKLAKDRPDDPTIQDELFQAYIKTGDAARQQGSGESALKYYAQAINCCPKLRSNGYAPRLFKRAVECVKEEVIRAADRRGTNGALAWWLRLARFCDSVFPSLRNQQAGMRELADAYDLAASSIHMIGSDDSVFVVQRIGLMNDAAGFFRRARNIYRELKDDRAVKRLDEMIASCKLSSEQLLGELVPTKPPKKP